MIFFGIFSVWIRKNIRLVFFLKFVKFFCSKYIIYWRKIFYYMYYNNVDIDILCSVYIE